MADATLDTEKACHNDKAIDTTGSDIKDRAEKKHKLQWQASQGITTGGG